MACSIKIINRPRQMNITPNKNIQKSLAIAENSLVVLTDKITTEFEDMQDYLEKKEVVEFQKKFSTLLEKIKDFEEAADSGLTKELEGFLRDVYVEADILLGWINSKITARSLDRAIASI